MGKCSARRVFLTITNLFSELAYVHTYLEQCFSRRHERLPDEVWTATVLNWNKSFTHIEHHAGAVGRSIRSSPLWYFFTSATDRIPVRAKCALGAASLCHRNRAEVPVLLCEQKPYPIRFSRLRKSHPVEREQLTLIMVIRSIYGSTMKRSGIYRKFKFYNYQCC